MYMLCSTQASIRPISYISKVPKNYLEPGQVPSSAKERSPKLLKACVKEWVFKKYRNPKKLNIIQELFPLEWKSELVANNVKYEEEFRLIEEDGRRSNIIFSADHPFKIKTLFTLNFRSKLKQ